MDVATFLHRVDTYILNPFILLLFGVAFLIFFVGLVQFVRSAQSDTAREEGKRKIVYGLIGMFIMFSAYGIIRLILNTFGLSDSVAQHETYIKF